MPFIKVAASLHAKPEKHKLHFSDERNPPFWCADAQLSPGQTEWQVVTSGRKLNLRRNLRWVVKRTRKLPRKYTQFANKNILRQFILYFIG